MTLFISTLLGGTALAYDHQHTGLAEVLDGVVGSDGLVDYTLLKSRQPQLKAYLDTNANANVATFDHDQQVAFWVNSYNAHTLNLIVDRPAIPASIMDLKGGKVWEQVILPVGRKRVTLNQIEHEILRPMTDGRIHAVVNCASKGCPPLPPKPLVGTGIDAQLEEGARRWVSSNAFHLERGVLQLSQIFQWYAEDFTGMPKGTASDAEMQKAARAFIEKRQPFAEDVKSVSWMDYDWSLNGK